MNILELESKIKQYATSYYEGRSEISDSEFDELVNQLAQLDPQNKILSMVGWGYEVEDKSKQPHEIITRGLNKTKSINDLTVPKNAIVTPKYDGLSVTAYYKIIDNNISYCDKVLTRGGDSGYGKPVRSNIYPFMKQHKLDKMPSKVKAINFECVVNLNEFQLHMSSIYDLPRSAAAGLALSHNRSELADYLVLIPLRIYFNDDSELSLITESDVTKFKSYFIEYEKSLKIEYLSYMSYHDNDIPELEKWSNNINYPTDGVVLWDSVALKFETVRVNTIVRDIKRQISRLGKLIPVLEFDSVKLYGTTVSRCTMNTESWLRKHNVGIGSVIEITKANEIIPQFTRTIESNEGYKPPTVCPYCNGVLTTKGEHLFCESNCVESKSRLYKFVFTYGSKLGYSESSLSTIFAQSGINNIYDFLRVAGNIIIPDQNITSHLMEYVTFLNKTFSSKLDLSKLLESLNLPGVGSEWSIKLSKYLPKWLESDSIPLQLPFTVNYNVYESLIKNKDLIMKVYDKFQWGINEPQSNPATLKITITGKLSVPKNEFCQQYNLEQVDISKSTILICSNKSSNSSKMQYARLHNLEVLTEEEFLTKYINR